MTIAKSPRKLARMLEALRGRWVTANEFGSAIGVGYCAGLAHLHGLADAGIAIRRHGIGRVVTGSVPWEFTLAPRWLGAEGDSDRPALARESALSQREQT